MTFLISNMKWGMEKTRNKTPRTPTSRDRSPYHFRNPITGVHTTGFKDFLLAAELQRAIVDCGFEHPSEVQQECIPQAVIGVDIIC